jgi:hypothetical protein
MSKEQLADAIERKEKESAIVSLSGELRNLYLEVRQVKSAVEEMRLALEGILRQQVETDVGSETQLDGQTTSQDPVPETTKPGPSQEKNRERLGRIGREFAKILVTVILTLIGLVFASDLLLPRLADILLLREKNLPVSTSVNLLRNSGSQGLTWALPRRLGPLNNNDQITMREAGDPASGFTEWIRKQGGVDVNVSYIRLEVTGERQSGVRISGMRAQFVDRRGPLRGALFYERAESEQKNSRIGFNLDEREPIARQVLPGRSFKDPSFLGEPYFEANSVPLAGGETQTFSIVAVTKSQYYAWKIVMEVSTADGRKQDITVGFRQEGEGYQEQKPFEITAQLVPRNASSGRFALYRELYVLNDDDPPGFRSVDPKTYHE